MNTNEEKTNTYQPEVGHVVQLREEYREEYPTAADCSMVVERQNTHSGTFDLVRLRKTRFGYEYPPRASHFSRYIFQAKHLGLAYLRVPAPGEDLMELRAEALRYLAKQEKPSIKDVVDAPIETECPHPWALPHIETLRALREGAPASDADIGKLNREDMTRHLSQVRWWVQGTWKGGWYLSAVGLEGLARVEAWMVVREHRIKERIDKSLEEVAEQCKYLVASKMATKPRSIDPEKVTLVWEDGTKNKISFAPFSGPIALDEPRTRLARQEIDGEADRSPAECVSFIEQDIGKQPAYIAINRAACLLAIAQGEAETPLDYFEKREAECEEASTFPCPACNGAGRTVLGLRCMRCDP